MTKILLCIVVVLAGCRGEAPEPDYTTKHGVAVFTDGLPVTQEAVEAELDRFAADFPEYDLAGIVILWECLPFWVLTSSNWKGWVAGAAYKWSRRVRVSVWPSADKVMMSALYHEIEHLHLGCTHAVPLELFGWPVRFLDKPYVPALN